MKSKILASATIGMLLFGGVVGLGVLAGYTTSVRAAAAAQTATQATAQAADQQQGGQPVYTSSVQAPNPQDAADKGTEDNGAAKGEDGTDAALQALAKITPEQAKAAALAAVPGTVVKVDLDNENGNVVYSVEVQTANSATEVKVDAGNGKVLSQDSQGADEEKATKAEPGEKEAKGGPDLDQVQEEVQSETR